MFDVTFGEIEYTEDYGFTAHRQFVFGGKEQSADILIMCDDEEEGITQFQRNAFEALMQEWEEIQHKISVSILRYYNEEEKGSYGPEDLKEFASWWPDIDNEDQLINRIHLDSIVIEQEYVMESKGSNPVYVLFNRDWGGKDMDDNGVAVLITDGEVIEVGYKDIAF